MACDQVQGRVLVEHDDQVDEGIERKHVGPLVLGDIGPGGALEPPDRGVGVQSQDEEIALAAGELQEVGVAIVEDVEAAVGEDDLAPGLLHLASALAGRGQRRRP